MKPQDASEAIRALVNTVPTDEQPELFGLLRESYPQNLGGVAVEGSQMDSSRVEQEPYVPSWEQQLEGLPAEKHEAANLTGETLVKKYETKGYTADDFSLIKVTKEGPEGQKEDVLAVALTATEAIDLGDSDQVFDKRRSWNSIDPVKADEQFMVKIKGKKLDVRADITLEAMREVAAQNPEISEWVWESGRPDLADAVLAPIGGVLDGRARRRRYRRDDDYGALRFRPVVVIG